MKIYGFPPSTCTRKVLMTLHEKNHPYEFVLVNIQSGEQKQPPHLERHPFGVVPVMDDDGFMLYEARAIIRYLDVKLPDNSLTPTDVKNFGEMQQWISVEQSYLSEPAIALIKQLYFGKMQRITPDTAIIEDAKPKVEHALEVAEKKLSKQLYFAGPSFSLADISWMPYIEYLFPSGLGELINNRPALKAWWERVSKRPSWLKIVGKFE